MRIFSLFGAGVTPLLLALSCATTLTTGCTIRLIADYDEEIDAAATSLQKQMDAFLTEIAASTGAEATHAHHARFYQEYAVEVRSVRIRAASHPKNAISITQYDRMLDSLQELEAAHRDGPIGPEVAAQFRSLFNQAWGAIIALEVAKKRNP